MIHSHPSLFFSNGVPVVGRFYRNTQNLFTRQPAVIVTGSWLTVKEQMATVYAERLAERGYTAFTFDFAGFGESGGVPAQAEIPTRKISDILAAANFVSICRDFMLSECGFEESARGNSDPMPAFSRCSPLPLYLSPRCHGEVRRR